MAERDILEIAAQAPETLSVEERLIIGLALLLSVTGQEETGLNPEQRSQFLHGASELFAEAFFTLGRGLETPIRQKIDESYQNISRLNYELAATIMLSGAQGELTALGQVRHIQNASSHKPEDRRDIAVAWAKHRAAEISDDEFAVMFYYFGQEMHDMNAVFAISEVRLTKLEQETDS